MFRWRVLVAGVALTLFAHGLASGQALPLIRRSAAPTPRVTDVTVIRQQRVDIGDRAGLDDLTRSATLTLDFFPDLSLRAARVGTDGTAVRRTWMGVLEGYPTSSVIFVSADNELIGHVHAPFGFFRVERQTDGTYLVQQVDQSIFAEGNDEITPGEPALGATAAPRIVAADLPIVAAADDGSVVDVLVAITEDAVVGYGSESRARATVDLLVAETNVALRNSGVSARIRLVHAAVVPYVESGDSSTDLNRAAAPGDGFLDQLPALRDTYAADLVAVITEQMESAYCGRGYINAVGASGRFAYSVTARRCTANGRTFAHELGHNMGATHDWYVSGLTSGAFTYSKGYVSLPGRFRDVMAYFDLCRDTGTSCSQWLGFANPAIAQNGQSAGVAAGTSLVCVPGNTANPDCDADVVRTFANIIPTVARFRDSATSINARFEMLPGATVSSANLRWRLVYQTDGNLVLYDDVLRTAPWASYTAGTSPGRVLMQADGNLVIYDQLGRGVWSTGTVGYPGAYVVLQNDGNLVIYAASGQPLWGRMN